MGTGAMKLLVLIDGPVEGEMRSPEIRSWELAGALAGRFDVTVLADTASESTRDGVRVAPRTRRRVLAEALRNDAVLAPWPPPYALLAAAVRRRVCVADLYDPVDRELATVPTNRHFVDELRAVRSLTRIHLRFANVITFASESQREALLDALGSSGGERGAQSQRVAIVPMGISGSAPHTDVRPIREVFPAIGADDPVVLWWGSLWRWLDPDTAIRAVRLLVDRGRPVKLVFTAGPPADDVAELATTEEARALAARLGLLDAHVFFFERWVPYEDRHHWLSDADLGISLHRSEDEGRLAARARYMDFLWARLPCVITAGGDVGRELAQAGLAESVAPADPDAVAAAIWRWIERDGELPRGEEGVARLGGRHEWAAAALPLAEAIESAAGSARPPIPALLGDVVAFYMARVGRRLRGKLADWASGFRGIASRREARRA